MMRTSFITYVQKRLLFWAWPAFGRPLSKVGQQSSFQRLAAPLCLCDWVHGARTTSERGENKASEDEGGENAEGD